MAKTIAVLGSGSWGTALAVSLARNGHDVHLWGREAQSLQGQTENAQFLPGVPFPDRLQIKVSLNDAILSAEMILIVVPSIAFSDTLLAIQSVRPDAPIAWATKGIDHSGTQLLSDLVDKCLPNTPSMTVITGPTFAMEVAKSVPSALTVASNSDEAAAMWISLLSNDVFKAMPCDDILGVQVASAVKNVIAIASGMIDGMGYGANTRCALITQGLQEMAALGLAMGAKESTFMSLAGIGDLMLTATDDQSRNRRFGLALGRGESLDQAEQKIGQVVEGRLTCGHIVKLASRYHVEMPIANTLQQIFDGNKSLSDLPPLWFCAS